MHQDISIQHIDRHKHIFVSLFDIKADKAFTDEGQLIGLAKLYLFSEQLVDFYLSIDSEVYRNFLRIWENSVLKIYDLGQMFPFQSVAHSSREKEELATLQSEPGLETALLTQTLLYLCIFHRITIKAVTLGTFGDFATYLATCLGTLSTWMTPVDNVPIFSSLTYVFRCCCNIFTQCSFLHSCYKVHHSPLQ